MYSDEENGHKKVWKVEEDRISKYSSAASSTATTTQAMNSNTGHWIVVDSKSGKRYVSEERVHGIVVEDIVQSAPLPSSSQEAANIAEQAVLNFLNKKAKVAQ